MTCPISQMIWMLLKTIRDFKEAIEYNREPLVNGDNGKIAVELVNEIYLQQSYLNNILGG